MLRHNFHIPRLVVGQRLAGYRDLEMPEKVLQMQGVNLAQPTKFAPGVVKNQGVGCRSGANRGSNTQEQDGNQPGNPAVCGSKIHVDGLRQSTFGKTPVHALSFNPGKPRPAKASSGRSRARAEKW